MRWNIFWKKYVLALKRSNDKESDFEKSILKHPLLYLFAGMLLIGLVLVTIYQTATYVPPIPEPPMTIFSFFSRLQTVELPWIVWAGIILFFWLTKW